LCVVRPLEIEIKEQKNIDFIYDIMYQFIKIIQETDFPMKNSNKEQILHRSLEFYKKVLILLENNELSPWVIERLEPYIFNKHIN
jgi:hypothetical protein